MCLLVFVHLFQQKDIIFFSVHLIEFSWSYSVVIMFFPRVGSLCVFQISDVMPTVSRIPSVVEDTYDFVLCLGIELECVVNTE